jgi:peptidoglycan hydrolase CwlO-like protein
MVDHAEIERLQRQIVRLRGQIEENESRIRSLETKIARTEELYARFSQRRAGFEQFIMQEGNRLLGIGSGSNLRISTSYTASYKDDYVGSCSRRLRTEDAFQGADRDIRITLDEYGEQINSLRTQSRSHEDTIDELRRQIYRLLQAI